MTAPTDQPQQSHPTLEQWPDSPVVKVIKDYERFRDGFLVKDCYFVGGTPPMIFEEEKLPDGSVHMRVVAFRMADRYCFDIGHFPHVTPEQLREAIKLSEKPNTDLDGLIDDICANLVDIQLRPFQKPEAPKEPGTDSPGFGK